MRVESGLQRWRTSGRDQTRGALWPFCHKRLMNVAGPEEEGSMHFEEERGDGLS